MTIKIWGEELQNKKEREKLEEETRRSESQLELKKMLEMKINEDDLIKDFSGLRVTVLRVPNGWLYITELKHKSVSSIFVSENEMINKLSIDES